MIANSARPTSIEPSPGRPHRIAVAASAALLLALLPTTGCRSPEPRETGSSERGAGQEEGETPRQETTPTAGGGEAHDEDHDDHDEPPVANPPDGPFPSMGGSDGAYQVAEVETRYTRDIEGQGALYATLDTSKGAIRCRLYEEKVPRTVDNFVGLARGLKPWRDPKSGETVKRPLYDGLVFHRVIPGLLIQSGDPSGTGHGHPGFFIEDEFDDTLRHNQAGVLSMAQSRPDGNGSQFFITDGPAPQFDARYPIFGLCGDTDIVHAIATTDTGTSRIHRPAEPVVLRGITFERR